MTREPPGPVPPAPNPSLPGADAVTPLPPPPPAPVAASAQSHEAALTVFPNLSGFRVIQELNRSPKGIIYKVRRLAEQDVVAIKVFRDAVARELGLRDRLRKGISASLTLRHLRLVRCLACLDDDGRVLLAQEYAGGEPLSRALQRNVRFLPPRALALALQIAEGLNYAANLGCFHGRLHPGDVMIAEDEARILGTAMDERPEHPVWQSRNPHLFEPLIYTAPEALPSQARAEDPASRRAADLYSLGALLFHMLTGAPPFRGADEAALAQERAALAPNVVRWPSGSQDVLPPGAVALAEQLLAPLPARRGDWSGARNSLRELLGQVEPSAAARSVPVSAPLPPAESGAPHAPARPAVSPGGWAASPLPASTPPLIPRAEAAGPRQPILLIAAVTGVLAFSAGLAVKTFLVPQGIFGVAGAVPATTPPPASEGGPVPRSGVGPGPNATAAPSPAALTPAAEAACLRQVEVIEQMLQTGEAKADLGTLRVLRELAEKAGPTTHAGLKAQILAREVEERMARGAEPLIPRPPAGVPLRTGAPPAADVEERAFQDLAQRARELAAQFRFADAQSLLREFPPALKLAPYPERAAQELSAVEQKAKAAYAELSIEAEKALAEGNYAKAREKYLLVQARFGIPELMDAAGARLRAIAAGEDQAQRIKAAHLAGRQRLEELAAFVPLFLKAAALAADCQYAEARETIEAFAKVAQHQETRELALEHARLLQDEQWYFERCRKRLADEIARNGGKSPYVLNNVPGNPTVNNLSEKGIHASTAQGKILGEVAMPWRKFDPRQHLVLFEFLMDKADARERFGLGVVVFHRLAREEQAVREGVAELARNDTPNGRKALEQRKAIVVDLKEAFERELAESLKLDASARARTSARQALMNRLLELAAQPPPARPGAP